MSPRKPEHPLETGETAASVPQAADDPARTAAWARTLDPADEASAREYAATILSRLAVLAEAIHPSLDGTGADPVIACLGRLAGLMETFRRAEAPPEGWDPWLGLPRDDRRRHPAGQFLLEFRRLGAALFHTHEALTAERARLVTERGELDSRRSGLAEIGLDLDSALRAGGTVWTTARGGFRRALDRRLAELRHHRAMLDHQRTQLELVAVNLAGLMGQVDDTLAATLPLMRSQMAVATGLLRALAVEISGSPGTRARLEARLDRLAADAAGCRDVAGLQRLFAELCSLIDRSVRAE